MRNDFRQAKYLNETGSKQGQYFVNRLDYFEFHQYPKYKMHKTIAVILFFLGLHLLSYSNAFSSIIWLTYAGGCLYMSYVSAVSFIILHRQLCKYRGYFLYPKSWLKFFISIQKEVDLDDFDSTATIHHKKH